MCTCMSKFVAKIYFYELVEINQTLFCFFIGDTGYPLWLFTKSTRVLYNWEHLYENFTCMLMYINPIIITCSYKEQWLLYFFSVFFNSVWFCFQWRATSYKTFVYQHSNLNIVILQYLQLMFRFTFNAKNWYTVCNGIPLFHYVCLYLFT